MPRKRLTEPGCKRARYLGRGQYSDYSDTEQPGLILRVYPSNRRCWYAFRPGSTNRVKLGSHPEMDLDTARDAALDYRRSPLAPPKEPKRTVADLVAHYREHYRTRVKFRRPDEDPNTRLYLDTVLACVGDLMIEQLTPDDVRGILSRWNGRPYSQNRCRALISGLYSYAVEIDWYRGPKPTRGIRGNPERPRNRRLTTSEVDTILLTIRQIAQPTSSNAIHFAAHSGARIGEVLTLRWEDVREDSYSFSETKNGRDRTLPITDTSRAILEDQATRSMGNPFVFGGRAPGEHLNYRTVYRWWIRACALAEVEGAKIHDLRHYLSTKLLNAHVPPATVARITGHANPAELHRTYHDIGVEDLKQHLEQEKLEGAQRVHNGCTTGSLARSAGQTCLDTPPPQALLMSCQGPTAPR